MNSTQPVTAGDITFRKPAAEDGPSVSALIRDCPPLDVNSDYCNLVQCHHFADTTVIAKLDGNLVGYISGYLIPGKPDTLFIWQVAVDEAARGRGLALTMLKTILEREGCQSVRFVETTITEDNAASWALFRRLADEYAAALNNAPLFEKDRHFAGAHDTELLVTIGPLRR